MRQWTHFIDGERRDAQAFAEAFDPRTGDACSKVALAGEAEVDAAVRSAGRAFAAWRARRPIERGRILQAIARALREKAGDFIAVERSETGKPFANAARDVETAAAYFEFYGGLVNTYAGEVIGLGDGLHSYTLREPFGPVAVITPWNAPVNQAGRGIAPALAAGNCVVAKPASATSGTTAMLAELAHACGVPAGVFNVVLGSGSRIGPLLAGHPGIRKIAFTGSVDVGREIGRIAAERIIPVTLELGGKSPNIVFADADFEAAVKGARKGFTTHAGQVCLSGTRLLVQDTIHDAFVEALVEEVRKIRIGPQDDADIGPITTKSQYQRILGWFEEAKRAGLTAATGGAPEDRPGWGSGWYVPPTIYTGVTNGMRIAREEIFGPVLVVMPFKDEAEAIAIANDSDYGLAAGIWTENVSRAIRVAGAIQSGQVYVNEYIAGGVETPLGGYKESGLGREKGIEALHHYTQLKSVTIKLLEVA